MKIVRGFDKDTIRDIAKNCGSKSVKSSISFLERMNYLSPDKLVCEVIDDVGFYGACICKKHLRLYEIAVREDAHKQGYGKVMMMRMVKLCRQKGLEKITFRTAKNETAVEFYKKLGAVITGEKGEDWEMELRV